jgi:hypothetical protein
MTDPMSAGRGAQAMAAMATTPMAAALAAGRADVLPAVSSGVATQFWAELVAYPPGSARSLWLLVGGAWKRYDNASAHWEDMVQRAFASGQTVQVWYDGEVIVGLVVNN